MNQLATTPAARPAFSLTPTSIQEAMEFAQMLSKSNLVPKDYQGNPSNCIIAMQWGMEIGLQPLQAMQSIAVINGRPSIWGDAMLALVRGSGVLESISETLEEGDTVAVCTVKRRAEQPATRRFSLEDAKKAGLTGKQGPWTQYPKRMLQLRARAFALRDVFPDVLRGVHIAEEAQDLPRETRDMGPVDEVKPEAPKLDHKPASRADKARAALASRKAAAEHTTESLELVLNAIHQADTMEALRVTADMAARLQTEDDKTVARDAYATRKAQLSAPVDASTGEILEPALTSSAQPATAEHADFLEGME